jgi:hypothetical protein
MATQRVRFVYEKQMNNGLKVKRSRAQKDSQEFVFIRLHPSINHGVSKT